MDIMLPDDAPEEVRRLGEPLAVFHGGRLVLALCWIFGVLALLVGLGGLIGLITLFAEAPAKGGGVRSSFKLMILGIGALSVGIGLIRKARASGGLRVFVCTEGIARARREQTKVMRWENINVVKRIVDAKKQELTIATPAQLILVDREGRELVFNETISDLRELRQMVEEHTLKFMLRPAIEAFQSGARIGFGDVSVSPEGIHNGRDTLPWDLFESAEVSKGRLVLYSSNGKRLFGRVDLSKVPNVHVLLALAEHARARHA
jgi:hypothetical protein